MERVGERELIVKVNGKGMQEKRVMVNVYQTAKDVTSMGANQPEGRRLAREQKNLEMGMSPRWSEQAERRDKVEAMDQADQQER